MKCWIIEQGSYSDYRVVGIFSTLENAERMLAWLPVQEGTRDAPEITERELDPGVAEINEGLIHYGVSMRVDSGEVVRMIRFDGYLESHDLSWTDPVFYSVWARDEQHATKIAAERWTQERSEQALGVDATDICPDD